MTPNKANLSKWVHALRTTKRKQGTEALNHKNNFCCLGIACEVAIRHGVPIQKRRGHLGTDLFGYDGEVATLPREVCGWLGVGQNPVIALDSASGHPISITAIAANDIRGWTFHEIAGAIEEYYEL